MRLLKALPLILTTAAVAGCASRPWIQPETANALPKYPYSCNKTDNCLEVQFKGFPPGTFNLPACSVQYPFDEFRIPSNHPLTWRIVNYFNIGEFRFADPSLDPKFKRGIDIQGLDSTYPDFIDPVARGATYSWKASAKTTFVSHLYTVNVQYRATPNETWSSCTPIDPTIVNSN